MTARSSSLLFSTKLCTVKRTPAIITACKAVRMIVDGKVYLSAWVEEGWDDDNNCATEEYKYYEKMIVRDFKGNVLSETIGSLQQHPDGTWWIS